MKNIKCASVFSGIGGFELGLSWSIPNLEIVWQVEIDSFCRSILAKHFPNAIQYDDIKTFDTQNDIDTNIDMLIGGFPCQNISIASIRRNGIYGNKSGLFWEMLRIIRRIRPKIVLMENVSALLIRGGGMATVLGQLAEIGYCVEWFCLEAKDFGLPHKRRRVFIVAYSHSLRARKEETIQTRRIHHNVKALKKTQRKPAPEPLLYRMDDGFFSRIHHKRLRALGNAIVPQKTEWIGKMLIQTNLIHDILGAEYQ